MTHDDRPTDPGPVTDTGSRAPDGAVAAFVPAIGAGLSLVGSWRSWFRAAAAEVGIDQQDAAIDDDQDAALRNRYAHATLQWNKLAGPARRHGVAFSLTAEAHHRAAVLDLLDDLDAPTLLVHRHLTWVQPIDEDGYPDNSPTHPAARAIYRFNSQRYPSLYPPERNTWSAEQWRQHEQRLLAEWLAKCSPEARVKLEAWARRINAERDAGTCTTSWRAPGYRGPRGRSAPALV